MTHGHSTDQRSTGSSVGRADILFDIVGVGLYISSRVIGQPLCGWGRQEQHQNVRTGSNGSLTSQTEVFDPTLNSRSSLVIAASMSASRSQFPASSALPEAKSLRLTVPVLVYHHDAQQHAERKDEDSVNVMRDGIANGVAESDHDDHSSDIEEDSEELHCSRDKVSIRCLTPADVLLAKRTISPMAHLSSSVLMTRIN